MTEWECKICGHVHKNKEPPEFCPICEGEKKYFKKVDHREHKVLGEEHEVPVKKKKYRRIFKKGFTRKYKKYKK